MKLDDFSLWNLHPTDRAPVGTKLFCIVANTVGLVAGLFLLAFTIGAGASLGLGMF